MVLNINATLTIQSDDSSFSLVVHQSVANFLAVDGRRWPTRDEHALAAYNDARVACQASKARRAG